MKKSKLKRLVLRLQHDIDALAKSMIMLNEDIKNHQCYCENYKPKTVEFKRFMPVEKVYGGKWDERETGGESGGKKD